MRLPRATITGRVVRASDGEPIGDATVQLYHEASPMSYEGTSSVQDGRYWIGPLMSGSYWVVARGPTSPGTRPDDQDLGAATLGPIRVEDGEVDGLDFSLRAGGEVRVVVRDPDSKAVRLGAVALRPEAPRPGPPPYWSEILGDADGVRRLRGVAPGRYRVDVRADGFAMPASGSVVVRPGEVAECAMRIDRGTEVRVRLVSSSGAPLIEPSVKLTDVEGREIEPTRYAQDGEPSEVVAHPRLVEGTYSVSAGARGHAKAILPIEVRRGSREEFVVKLEKERAR